MMALHAYRLETVYFKGNAPDVDAGTAFMGNTVTIYCTPKAQGFGKKFCGRPVKPWKPEDA
jgi:hypothetical protein